MKKILSTFIFSLIALGGFAQTFRNPIIPGYHPDPSICRVGDTFYLVNSSFCSFPGVPISVSKDLVNWKQLGNVLDRESQLPLKGTNSWLGIYAPTIRYNDGTYYMITTNVGNGGNFMVTAKDPAGPWSEPIWLKQDGIDPSLYFEDGKCYMCSNPGDAIWLCEIDPKTGKQLTESKQLWRGDGGRYPEGPHIYKKDGYYYLLISEGGTELAHHLTIARSKKIYGPYESNPANPILTNCNRLGQTKQIQGTGHGDFVQDKNGNWWIVFLAYRNFGGSYHHLGRETYLAPVKWEKGKWPDVNDGQPVDSIMSAANLLVDKSFVAPKTSCKIDVKEPSWLYIQNPIKDKYEYKNGKLRMYPHGTLTENDRPTFLGKRQTSERMNVETEVELQSSGNNNKAGLSVYQINDGHIDFYITETEKGNVAAVSVKLKSIESKVEVAVKSDCVKLRITSDGTMYKFEASDDEGKTWKKVAEHNCSLVSTEVAGGFTGVIIGMYCEGDKNTSADFDYYDFH